jgi:hypothetical protein
MERLIKEYNIGGLIPFQCSNQLWNQEKLYSMTIVVSLKELIIRYQTCATPLLMSIDAEWA